MEITEMTLTDLENMKDTLYSDFDNFWSYNILKQELENKNTTYIIAKENNEVVGFAGISICLDEATLNNIVVKKSCRGRGLGGELLESLIDICSDLNIKTLWCGYYDGNIKSKRVQEKCGFKYHHTEENYFCELMNEYRTCHYTIIKR